MKTLLILCSIAFLFLAGCASNIESLQRESARNMGSNLKKDMGVRPTQLTDMFL